MKNKKSNFIKENELNLLDLTENYLKLPLDLTENEKLSIKSNNFSDSKSNQNDFSIRNVELQTSNITKNNFDNTNNISNNTNDINNTNNFNNKNDIDNKNISNNHTNNINSFIFSIFPIYKNEYKQIFLNSLSYCIIGFISSFFGIFKENVIFSKLKPESINFLRILVFLGSILLTYLEQKSIKRNGVFEGIKRIWYMLSYGFLFLSILIYLKISKVNILNIEIFSIGKTAELRSNFFKDFSLILKNWIYTLFYVISEVFGSFAAGHLFMVQMNFICTENQQKRFIRIVLASAAIGTAIAGILYFLLNKYIFSELSYKNRENSYIVMCLLGFVLFYIIGKISEILKHTKNDSIENDSTKKEQNLISDKNDNQITNKNDINDNQNDINDIIHFNIYSSYTLIATCLMTFCYNITHAIETIISKSSYKAFGDYLKINPSVQIEGIPSEPNEIAGHYGSLENIILGIFSILFLLMPFSRKLFKKYGIIFYGFISVIFMGLGIIIVGYFGIKNNANNVYAFDTNINNIKNYLNEVRFITFFLIINKLAKYVFFDIIRESISIKVDPKFRAEFKGISEGIVSKLGVLAGSAYFFVIALFQGNSDARNSLKISVIFVLFCCVCWGISIIYLDNRYKRGSAYISMN